MLEAKIFYGFYLLLMCLCIFVYVQFLFLLSHPCFSDHDSLIKNHFKLILFVQKNHNFFYFPPPNRKCIHPYSTDTFPVFFSDATLLMRFFLCVYYFCRNTNALPHWISFFVSVAYLDMIHNEGGYVILLGNSWKSLLPLLLPRRNTRRKCSLR